MDTLVVRLCPIVLNYRIRLRGQMGQTQFQLLRPCCNFRMGGGVPLGTRCSAATYDMGPRTNLPVSLSRGHILTPPLPCQWTPHANAPPFLERRNTAPLANGPPVPKEETCPPPQTFFTKSHTNCPVLPSFPSVTLFVSCLILHLALLPQNLTIAVPESK